jgi:hypothetical protein
MADTLKKPGDLIQSEEWNDLVEEVHDKVDKAGNETIEGPLTIASDEAMDHSVNLDSVVPLKITDGQKGVLLDAQTVQSINHELLVNPAGNLVVFGSQGVRIGLAPTNYILMGVTPQRPIILSGGAYCDGKQWIDATDKTDVTNVKPLEGAAAVAILNGLKPQIYRRRETGDENRFGLFAEELPDALRSRERAGVSTHDVVAVLTSVVKQQQAEIEELKRRLQ